MSWELCRASVPANDLANLDTLLAEQGAAGWEPWAIVPGHVREEPGVTMSGGKLMQVGQPAVVPVLTVFFKRQVPGATAAPVAPGPHVLTR